LRDSTESLSYESARRAGSSGRHPAYIYIYPRLFIRRIDRKGNSSISICYRSGSFHSQSTGTGPGTGAPGERLRAYCSRVVEVTVGALFGTMSDISPRSLGVGGCRSPSVWVSAGRRFRNGKSIGEQLLWTLYLFIYFSAAHPTDLPSHSETAGPMRILFSRMINLKKSK
jgi:hypothetical protein